MRYSVALHNETWQILVAVLLGGAGIWATVRAYARVRIKVVLLLGALVTTIALSVPAVFWAREDGPCGKVWGMPFTVQRIQTACGDIFDSTGFSWPLALANLVVASGVAHVLLLALSRVWKATVREC